MGMEDSSAILNGMAIIADRLGIDRTGKNLEETGVLVRIRVEADGERRLIVFDNVPDTETLSLYAPSVGASHVIVDMFGTFATACVTIGSPVNSCALVNIA